MELKKTPFSTQQDITEPLKTGTTTIGIRYKDGVIITTESQATAGFFVASRTAQKLFKVNDYVAATISGGVADCQYVVNQSRVNSKLREIETGDVPEPKFVANIVRNLLFQGRSYFLALMIVGGYSLSEQTGVLYGVDLLGTLFEEEKFLSFGSGSTYALGVLEAEYKPDMSEEEAVNLAKRAITSARIRDAGSGYEIQMIRINKDGFKAIEGYHEEEE